MQRRNLIHRVLNVAALLAMLIGLVPPAGATSTVPTVPVAAQTKTSTAPSTLAKAWPVPARLNPEPFSPFLDPTSLVLAQAVRGDIEPELVGNRRWLEPLESLGAQGSNSSPLLDKLTLPDSSSLSLANPPDNVVPDLPRPSDLAALTKHAEIDEEPLPFDEAVEGSGGAEAVTPIETKTVADEDTAATDLLDWSVTKLSSATINSESSPIPEGKPLARAAAVTGTVVTETTDLENDHPIFLPLILRNSSGSTPPPTDGEGIITPEEGGTLTFADNTIIVHFPAGAVNEEIKITFQALPAVPLLASSTTVSHFSLQAKSVSSGILLNTFNKSITISVQYPADAVSDDTKLLLSYLEPSTNIWVSLPSQHETTNHIVKAQTRHFTEFVVAKIRLASVIELAPAINEPTVTLPATFFTRDVVVNYTGGSAIVSSHTDGPYPLAADDAVRIIVTRPDSSTWEFYHESYTHDFPPIDLAPHLGLGDNTIHIELIDLVTPERGGGWFYLLLDEADNTPPPTIHSVNRWLDGNGQAIFQAYVTGAESGSVMLIFNGQTVVMTPVGAGLYEAIVPVPRNQISNFQVVAVAGGNVSIFPPSSPVNVPGYQSRNLGQYNFACNDTCNRGTMGNEGDPVNTATGNLTYHTTDLTVAGVGDTDIIIERNYNSLPNEPQGVISYTLTGDTVQEEPVDVHPEPFGPGWTFPLATHLLVLSNTLLQGVQVRYSDGHTANFVDNGDGTFSPVETRSYDEMTVEGDGFLLKRKDLMDYHFDAEGRLTRITDRNGNGLILSYNGDDLISATNDSGRTVTFEYNADEGLITDIFAPESRRLHYTYQDGRLHTYTDGRGNITEYQYDTEGRLAAIITPKTHPSLRLTYGDEIGRVTEQIIGATESYGFSYDDDNRTTTITDAEENQTTHIYDEAYRLVESRDALGLSEFYDYNDLDHRIFFQDRAGRQWNYTYDAKGNRLTADGPLDWHREFAYNPLNLVTKITERVDDTTTRSTEFVYDGKGNLTSIINALDDTSTIIYDPRGLPTHIFDFNDHETILTYDPLTGDLVQTENAEGDTTGFSYDGLGRLKTLTNGRGFVYTYSYDDNDNLTAVDGPLGYHLGYEYDPNNNLSKAIDPNGGETDYIYDASENLVEVRNQLDFPTFLGYNAMNYLTRLEDAEGRVWTYDYDAVYNRTAEHGPEDTHTFFAYNKVRNITDVIRCNSPLSGDDCPVKQITHYDYDDLDRISRVTNPEQHSIDFEHDLVDNLLTLTDARGYPTRFTYDLLDRLTLRVDALLGEWEYKYDDEGNLLLEIDANDHPNNAYSYDKANRMLTSTDAEQFVTRFSYDENSNLVTLTDSNNHPTTYTYDELDRLDSMTNAEQETTRYHYDLAGNQTHLIEADGIVTLYDYDAIFRLIFVMMNYRPGLAETADINADTHYGYDKVGNLLSILDAKENETRFSYDGLNRLVQEVDAEANVWDYQYDRVSNRTARIDANHNRTDYGYYPDNQLRRIDYHPSTGSGQAGTSVEYTYDENNNRLTMVDHLGTTTWVYDPLNRITDVTDPFKRHLGYAYDPVSNRTGLTYPDERTVTYTYYDNDRLKTVSDPEDNVTSYERDGVGQMTRTTNPNNTLTEASYDRANRLLTVKNYSELGNGTNVNSAFSYIYDEVGQRTRMVAEYGWRNPPVVSSDYTYDGLHRLIRDEDSEGVWTEYEFDRVGNRLRLRTNDDSLSPRTFDEKTLLYSYNAINQVLSIVGDTHPGQPGTKRQDNVGQALYAFRHEVAAQRGKHINQAAADNLLAMADVLITDLESDPAPNEAEVADAIEALRNQVMSYRVSGDIDSDGIENSLLVKLDKGDQANNGTAGDLQTTTFSYDANGNRTNKEFPGPQGPQVQGTDYTYDPENRLVLAQDYQLNQQGNRVDRAVTTLDYDGGGRRLVKVYDPKTDNGGQKRVEYVFDGLDPVAEYNIWNPQYDNFYRGDLGRILTMHHFPGGSQGQMYWYHYDGLGSVSGLTKQNGNSNHNYRYEPYGQLEQPPGNFTDPHNHYTFTGQELDEAMGLYEFYARAYDYDMGTWLQQDVYRGMIRNPRDLHRYHYAFNSPMTFIDKGGFVAVSMSMKTLNLGVITDLGVSIEISGISLKTTLLYFLLNTPVAAPTLRLFGYNEAKLKQMFLEDDPMISIQVLTGISNSIDIVTGEVGVAIERSDFEALGIKYWPLDMKLHTLIKILFPNLPALYRSAELAFPDLTLNDFTTSIGPKFLAGAGIFFGEDKIGVSFGGGLTFKPIVEISISKAIFEEKKMRLSEWMQMSSDELIEYLNEPVGLKGSQNNICKG